MVESRQPAIPRLTLAILAFALAGTPVVGYLWHTVNDLLAGQVRPVRLLIFVPVLVVFILLLRLLLRFVGEWEAERRDDLAPGAGNET
jgi:hypothetical protein